MAGYDGLRAGQLAAAAEVNLETLRYYERRGLLQAPGRTLGGHRLYPRSTVTSLRAIKTAQRLGFTLNEVADLVDTAHTDTPQDRARASRAGPGPSWQMWRRGSQTCN